MHIQALVSGSSLRAEKMWQILGPHSQQHSAGAEKHLLLSVQACVVYFTTDSTSPYCLMPGPLHLLHYLTSHT